MVLSAELFTGHGTGIGSGIDVDVCNHTFEIDFIGGSETDNGGGGDPR